MWAFSKNKMVLVIYLTCFTNNTAFKCNGFDNHMLDFYIYDNYYEEQMSHNHKNIKAI